MTSAQGLDNDYLPTAIPAKNAGIALIVYMLHISEANACTEVPVF